MLDFNSKVRYNYCIELGYVQQTIIARQKCHYDWSLQNPMYAGACMGFEGVYHMGYATK
jgi:hypothetical protein